MRKRSLWKLVLVLVLVLVSALLWPEPPSLSLHLLPGLNLPVGDSAGYFSIGPLVEIAAHYRIRSLSPLFLMGSLQAGQEQVTNTVLTTTSASAFAGAGVVVDLTPTLTVRAMAFGGYSYAGLDKVGTNGYGPAVGAGAGIELFITPSLSLGIQGAYRKMFGLSDDILVQAGFAWDFSGPQRRGALMQQPGPRPERLEVSGLKGSNEGLQIRQLSWTDVFPVFHTYYDNHPIGSATLVNLEKDPIADISLSLQIKEYMSSPKPCSVPSELKPGESRQIDLNALFTEEILGLTEGTKVPVDLNLKYRIKDKWYQETKVETVRILRRNSMTWDDDRRAAAFVTAMDPTVMTLSNNVVAMTKSSGSRALDRNLLSAMAIYETMRLYGVAYQVDPNSSYKEFSTKKNEVDFLKFPRQVLEHRAGDCDDLSILFSALLQSISIPTAFVTVPGHIYLAFALETGAERARERFSRVGDLIIIGDRAWIPLELTDRESGFLKAWESGAKQWRLYSARNQAGFYPVEDAWKVYEPAQLPGAAAAVALPSEDKIVRAFLEEMVRYVDTEIFPQVAKIQGDIKQGGETPRLINKLGVLYASYGLYDRAEREFKRALQRAEPQSFVPALLNMGNIYLLRDDPEKALPYLEQARAGAPDNPKVLLALSQANHRMENYGAAGKTYGQLKLIQPDLAQRYAYLDLRGDEASRAADLSGAKGEVEWLSEE